MNSKGVSGLIIFTSFLTVSLILLLGGCASMQEDYATGPVADSGGLTNVLSLVEIEDNKITLGAQSSFDYAVLSTDDPFKVSIELKGIRQGDFVDSIKPDGEGIREVMFMTKMMPEMATVVDVVLSMPLMPVHEIDGNTLTVVFKEVVDEPVEKDVSLEDIIKDRAAVDESGRLPIATAITKVEFKRELDSLQLKIVGNGSIIPESYEQGDKLIIDVPSVKVEANVPSEVVRPVKALRWEQRDDKVRIVLELERNVGHMVSYINDLIIVTLTSEEMVLSSLARDRREHAKKAFDDFSDEPRDSGVGPAESDGRVGSPTADSPIVDDERETASRYRGPASASRSRSRNVDRPSPGYDSSPVRASSPRRVEESPDEYMDDVDDSEGGYENMCYKGEILNITCGGAGGQLNLDFQKADIVPIFSLLSDISQCNIVVNPDDPSIRGKKITMKVRDSSWYEVANIIMKTHGLSCKEEGNIILLVSSASLAQEMKVIADRERLLREAEEQKSKAELARKLKEKEKAKALYYKKMTEPLTTRVFKISYADVNEIASILKGIGGGGGVKKGKKNNMPSFESPQLQKLTDARVATESSPDYSSLMREGSDTVAVGGGILSSRGSITVDTRTSSLIVTDVPSVMANIERLIKKLDKPTPQVLITTRIVEISKSSEQTLGIDWGFLSNSYDLRKYFISSFGAYMPSATGIVNVPQSGISFGIMNKQRTMGLDLTLNAIENTGNGRVLTQPRILTLDNTPASISQGVDEPYLVINQFGLASAAFKEIVVQIDVTPHITPDDSVLMDLKISKEDVVEFREIGGSSTPVTSTLDETTNVLVKDGETLVLGGLYKSKSTLGVEGVAGIKDIPILGWLFKTRKTKVDSSEYLIFITPRIVRMEDRN